MDRAHKLFSTILIGTLSGMAFAPPVQAKEIMSRKCVPEEVAVFAERIHVKCAPLTKKGYTKDIKYYAERINTRTPHIRYMLDTMLAAKANGRPLYIRFDMSDYKTVPGCKGSDCRRLISVGIR